MFVGAGIDLRGGPVGVAAPLSPICDEIGLLLRHPRVARRLISSSALDPPGGGPYRKTGVPMKKVSMMAIVVGGTLALTACEIGTSTTQVPEPTETVTTTPDVSPSDPSASVPAENPSTPGAGVTMDQNGTEVHAPGADVSVDDDEVEINAPGANVTTDDDGTRIEVPEAGIDLDLGF